MTRQNIRTPALICKYAQSFSFQIKNKAWNYMCRLTESTAKYKKRRKTQQSTPMRKR